MVTGDNQEEKLRFPNIQIANVHLKEETNLPIKIIASSISLFASTLNHQISFLCDRTGLETQKNPFILILCTLNIKCIIFECIES